MGKNKEVQRPNRIFIETIVDKHWWKINKFRFAHHFDIHIFRFTHIHSTCNSQLYI